MTRLEMVKYRPMSFVRSHNFEAAENVRNFGSAK